MHWILAVAIELNDGGRKDALVKLGERLGVHVETVRRWVRGTIPVPPHTELALRAIQDVRRLNARLATIKEAMDGY